MSYEKYTTQAFILKVYERNESDLVYKVWTKEFGIIFALAKSVRVINSKLRMILKKHDFIFLTLVKGKEIWRIVGGEELYFSVLEKREIDDLVNPENLLKNKDTKVYQKYNFEIKKVISEVVEKFLENEKKYEILFNKFLYFLDYFSREENYLEINKVKILFYFVVMIYSGYASLEIINIKDLETFEKFSSQDIFLHFHLNEKEIKNHVFQALKNSML